MDVQPFCIGQVMEVNFTIKELEIGKLKIEEGDRLIIHVTTEERLSPESAKRIRKYFEDELGGDDNPISVIFKNDDMKIDYTVIKA